MKIQNLADIDKLRERGNQSLHPKKPKISLSMSTCGLALGAKETYQDLLKYKDKQNLKISLAQTGCLGFCSLEPIAVLRLPDKPALLYTGMTTPKTKKLMRHVKNTTISQDGLLCKIDNGGAPPKKLNGIFEKIPEFADTEPFKNQQRLLLKNCGIIDPLNMAEYVAMGGCSALYRGLHGMTPEEVLEEVIQSGLRGRGGAWFSTGIKWKMARQSPGEEKFIICNADEGDPGAFKDRIIMEADPFKLFEGIVLAGYAVGSHNGIIYLREEYPHTFEFLKKAIGVARRYALLGRNILGSGFNFTIKIVRGGGSYVCGEETALMDSLEGEVGDPRLRPPFPIEKGLWARPTIVNNVETLSNVPMIIDKGSEWFASIGTEKAKGTKILSVVGKVKQPGSYEVPLGTSLDQVLYKMAGGAKLGKEIKAVQVGSPFGNFIPANNLAISLDPETLREMGSMIGSGVIAVLDQEECLVDILLHTLSFFVDESCGKCTPCREGLFQMKEIMTGIYKGTADQNDLDKLSDLAGMIKDFALCGLGAGAPFPILNGIKDFKKDFKAHITTGACPWSAKQQGADDGHT